MSPLRLVSKPVSVSHSLAFPEHDIYQNSQRYQQPHSRGWTVLCFWTLRDRDVEDERHRTCLSGSRSKVLCSLGAHTGCKTLCNTERHRSSATAPALLYLLHPCSRALPCARGVPFVLNITVHTPGYLLAQFLAAQAGFSTGSPSHLLSPYPEHKKGPT
jgi:hypothetical protein